MPERKKFGRNELVEALQDIANEIEIETRAYLIGGLAMIFHGSKVMTKDVDLIFDSKGNMKRFVKASDRIGFRRQGILTGEYHELQARSVLESANGIRFDIFHVQVCGALVLSEGMKIRSEDVLTLGKLMVSAVSIEDIFLFKAITSRPDDLTDMASLFGLELDWNIIEKEVMAQPDSWMWLGRLYGRLLELEEEHGVASPLIRKLKTDAEVAQAIGIIISRLEKTPISVEEISLALDENSEFISIVMNRMKKMDLLKEKDGLYYLAK